MSDESETRLATQGLADLSDSVDRRFKEVFRRLEKLEPSRHRTVDLGGDGLEDFFVRGVLIAGLVYLGVILFERVIAPKVRG